MSDVTTFTTLAFDESRKSKNEDERSHPRVGAVLVRNKTVLGSAHRGELGSGEHAEYTLLEKKLSGADLGGTTLFTTLEPCTSRGKHKPCADWIIEKNIACVYMGMLDPNPRVYAKGAKKLLDNGIDVRYFPANIRQEIEKDNHLFISQFRANPKPEGEARFNYTDNNGVFSIGSGEHLFDTNWSKASDTSIHIYNDPLNVHGVAVAEGITDLKDIRDADIFNMSSHSRTPKEGEYVVLKNTNGYFAVLHVLDIKDKSRTDSEDELTFEYWILEDKTSNFSVFENNSRQPG